MIASGGCSVLTMLAHPGVGRISAVDINPAQIQLVELKLAAIRTLDRDEFCHFVGTFKPPSGSLADYRDPARLKVYDARIRPKLSPAAQTWWDSHHDEIKFGINRAGRFEHLLRILSKELADIPKFDEPKLWAEKFDYVFSYHRLKTMFGASVVDYSMDSNFGDHFRSRFDLALLKWSPNNNYFLHSAFHDEYLPSQLPRHLHSSVYQSIQERLRRNPQIVTLVVGDIWKMSHANGGEKFDLVHTSNISDWMSLKSLQLLLENTAKNLIEKNGIIVMRRLNGDHDLANVVSNYFRYDKHLSEELIHMDRSFLYNEIIVGWDQSKE